jgi:hypothetical protein
MQIPQPLQKRGSTQIAHLLLEGMSVTLPKPNGLRANSGGAPLRMSIPEKPHQKILMSTHRMPRPR